MCGFYFDDARKCSSSISRIEEMFISQKQYNLWLSLFFVGKGKEHPRGRRLAGQFFHLLLCLLQKADAIGHGIKKMIIGFLVIHQIPPFSKAIPRYFFTHA